VERSLVVLAGNVNPIDHLDKSGKLKGKSEKWRMQTLAIPNFFVLTFHVYFCISHCLLWQQLPFVLFNKDLDPGFQLLEVSLLKEAEVPLNPIRIIDSLFLHDPVRALIPTNQQ
jgi:hypothetical protein